jgi:hypothetical protein
MIDPSDSKTWTADLERRAARDELISQIPRDARVAASERELPRLANRRWAYTLRNGIFDADYVLFSISLPWTRNDDLAPVQRVLQDQSFGVVDVSGPFALLRRSYDPARNQKVLRLIRRRKR